MTEMEWINCADFDDMLKFLSWQHYTWRSRELVRTVGMEAARHLVWRKLQLFACAVLSR